MADHSLPISTTAYAPLLTTLDGRIDDAAAQFSTALGTQPTNPPTNTIRWNNTNKNWQINNGTPASPNWQALATVYTIDTSGAHNGTVGATTPNTGAFTTLSTSGIASLGASSTMGAVAILSQTNTVADITNKTFSTGSVWNGGIIAITYGGTNSNATPTQGAVAYGTGTAYGFSAAGTSGQILISQGTAAPAWTSSPSITGLTLSGDIAVNGGDVTTTATTFNLVNTTATTVNLAGAATTLTVGATTGTLALRNPDISLSTVTGSNTIGANVTIGNITFGSNNAGYASILFNTASSSSTTGALVVSGGIGISGISYFGSNVIFSGTGAIKLPSGTTLQVTTLLVQIKVLCQQVQLQ